MTKLRDIRAKVDLLLMLVALPLIGLAISRKSILGYLEFPPLTRYVQHAEFSWLVFIGLAIVILAVVTPFILRVLYSQLHESLANHQPSTINHRPFPWWGWAGLALAGIAWFMAWTRFAWFAPLQAFTFTPIWIGYILIINGLTYCRTGHCMLRDRRGYFLCLFLVSAVFWWYFEYLNRFVQNWCYEGLGGLSHVQYFIFATLPFSTVLPAVLGTNELLTSIPRLSAGMDKFIKIDVGSSRVVGWIVLVCSCAGLAVIGIWPDYLFPLLWVSPLLIITALQAIQGRTTIFSSIRYGYWRRIYLLALSALICGFFWEMWNYHSAAKWVYLIPFVNRFKIFEMPILGYAGYLPFGLECAVLAEIILAKRENIVC